MQLTIDVKDSAVDKIMYLLKNLHDDVRIVAQEKSSNLDIALLNSSDDLNFIKNAREHRTKNPQDYGTIDDIEWS